jgi:hypothetical protein
VADTLADLHTIWVVKEKLRHRREDLWQLLDRFAALKDAHGVHDMAVEIQGIEITLKLLDEHE